MGALGSGKSSWEQTIASSAAVVAAPSPGPRPPLLVRWWPREPLHVDEPVSDDPRRVPERVPLGSPRAPVGRRHAKQAANRLGS